MSQKVFIQVFIKSQSDLPKEDGKYFVYEKLHLIGDKGHSLTWRDMETKRFDSKDKINIDWWLKDIDWYLQERELPTEEEMWNAAEKFEQEASYDLSAKGIISDEFYQGEIWLMSKLKT